MGFVPADARWFLADLVIEIRVEGDAQNVVHVNTVLVRADSTNEAYEAAMKLGADEEQTYQNPEGKSVVVKFRGLHELSVIHDPLEHGTELSYREEIGMDESAVVELVRHGSLAVYRGVEPGGGPNYMPKEIMDELVGHTGEDVIDRFAAPRDDQP